MGKNTWLLLWVGVDAWLLLLNLLSATDNREISGQITGGDDPFFLMTV